MLEAFREKCFHLLSAFLNVNNLTESVQRYAVIMSEALSEVWFV